MKAVAARHHGSRVRLFGSVARGDERPDSDIDLLVDFTKDSSLFDLMRLTRELENLLGHPVDVISTGGLKDRDQDILDDSSTCEPYRCSESAGHSRRRRPDRRCRQGRAECREQDRLRQLAVERLLEIIGESASALSGEYRAAYPDAPWRDVIGLRIVSADHYHRVDPNQVWVIACEEVPSLAEHLRRDSELTAAGQQLSRLWP